MHKQGDEDDAAESVPEQLRRELAAARAATGSTTPEDATKIPPVNLAATISSLALQVGMVLHAAPLYRHLSGLVTVHEETGEIEVMTQERFTSWVEDYVSFVRKRGEDLRAESIGKDLAGKLLAADKLKSYLRELKAVHMVRRPVWRGAGDKRTVELADPGFDRENGVLTIDALPYPTDLAIEDAFEYLREKLKCFQFELEGERNWAKSRSFAAMLAAMVGVYIDPLFPAGTPRPLVVVLGNQPGTGKSLLVRMILNPVHGAVSEAGLPAAEAEFEKILDSAALSRKPYLVLDDVKNLDSQALNRFITSPAHECRRMHSQQFGAAPKLTQVFTTGNNLTISEDLERRVLVVELFETGKAVTRRFPKEAVITNELLLRDEVRAEFLAALWAIVKHWRDKGMARAESPRPSFETWTGLVGGIVAAISDALADAFGPRRVMTGGDERGRALERVLAMVAGRHEPGDAPPRTDDILAAAEEADLLETIVGAVKNPKQSLGHRLKPLKGRHFFDTQGRRFEFGKRDLASGAAYPIKFLDEAQEDCSL